MPPPGWGIFTAYMAVAALRVNLAVLTVLALLTLTYVLLAVGAFQGGVPPRAATQVGGWFGIATGLVAWYASAATLINDTHGRPVLPRPGCGGCRQETPWSGVLSEGGARRTACH